MSKIRLHGSSSGYTEIAPVAASGNNTLTLPNDGTIISKDSNGAVGVTSITVGTGVTIGDGKITCDGSALTSINAAQLVGICTSGLTKTGGFGGTNTPAFSVYRNGTQDAADNTYTKVQYNVENFDTDNTFDSSTNYRYTPAFSGKSFLVASLRVYGTTDFNNFITEIHKNGTSVLRQQNSFFHYECAIVSGIVTHDADDYFEVYVKQQSGSTQDIMSGSDITYFMGYKLIE